MKQIYFSMLTVLFGFTASFAQTYSNGPISTGAFAGDGTPAPAGYTWSQIQNANTTLGAGGSDTGTASFVVADDFVVPAGESWNITGVSGFAYQTNYTGTTSPFIGFRMAIFNGVPGEGGTIVFGDLSANAYADATDANIYRIGTTINTARKIWKIDSEPISHTLTSGTYWLAYQVVTATAVAGWIPPVTIEGEDAPPGSNGRQRNTENVWAPSLDGGSGVTNAFPFEISYSVLSTESFSENSFDVYPNPVNNELNIIGKGFDILSVAVKDLNGRVIKSSNFDGNNAQINVQDLTAGVYMVTIKSNAGEVSKKIIKK